MLRSKSSPRSAASLYCQHVLTVFALKQKVNAASPTKYSYFKAHSPLRRSFNQKSAAKTNNFNKKVYTAKVNNVTTAGPEVVVSTAEGKRENVVKSSACWIWRPTGKVIDHISKDSGSYMPKIFDYVDPQGRLKYDNGTEFKNNDMNQLCGMKGIKREFSVARTPQQNEVAERKNVTPPNWVAAE
ncbi:ribonuclease H-like domain-containing protein [Tanacetum coccineum]